MRITPRQLRQIIKEEIAAATRKRNITEMHDPTHMSPTHLYKRAAHDVEDSYAPDYDELAYKIDHLDQEFIDATQEDGMTSLHALRSRYAKEIFIRIADALGYPQVDFDQDVLVPSRLVNAVIAEIKASLPSEEDF